MQSSYNQKKISTNNSISYDIYDINYISDSSSSLSYQSDSFSNSCNSEIPILNYSESFDSTSTKNYTSNIINNEIFNRPRYIQSNINKNTFLNKKIYQILFNNLILHNK